LNSYISLEHKAGTNKKVVCAIYIIPSSFGCLSFAITHTMLSPQTPEHFPALKLELKDKLHRKEKEAAMLLQVSFS
jgi:hypothetical protein